MSRRDTNPEPYADPDPTEWLGVAGRSSEHPTEQSWQPVDRAFRPADPDPQEEPTRHLPRIQFRTAQNPRDRRQPTPPHGEAGAVGGVGEPESPLQPGAAPAAAPDAQPDGERHGRHAADDAERGQHRRGHRDQRAEAQPSAREEILSRVRMAVRGQPEPDEDVPRTYRRALDLGHPEIVTLFAERVADYRATVRRIRSDHLPAVIAVCLVERAIRRVAVPADLPREWLPHYVDVRVDDGQMTAADLDAVDGVITGSALAIAETGTIVLDGGRWQGRRMLSLVPDYHLCVVGASTVVGNLPEALRRIEPTRPVTFISGPSATSDIELERVEGVHGPRALDVLLVE